MSSFVPLARPAPVFQRDGSHSRPAVLLMPRDFLLDEMSKEKYFGYAETKLIDELA